MSEPQMIPRFVWSIDEANEEEVCTDRLRGSEVVRYDMGDPANYAKSHGGWSKREWLEHKGLDPDAEIPLADSKVRVPDGEAERHADAKARRAQREKEEAEARDLLSFLGDDADDFDFDEYAEGEAKILRPALEKRGFKNVGFYMVEQDSFGPLIRGCRAIDPNGNTVRFFYG
jgi:hypothetical protein